MTASPSRFMSIVWIIFRIISSFRVFVIALPPVRPFSDVGKWCRKGAGTGLTNYSRCHCSWHRLGSSAPPETSIAHAYHLDQHKSAEADHHMSRLDEPVHGAYEQASLRESQGCENERIQDTARSQ